MKPLKILGYTITKGREVDIIRDENKRVVDVRMSSDDLCRYMGVFSPYNITSNTVTLFNEMSEVYFPVMAIVNRITNGKFQLKDSKTDTVIYDNKEINKFLSKPNPFQTFKEMIMQLEVYKLVTGNGFMYANTPDFLKSSPRWKTTSNYMVFPTQSVDVKYKNRIKLFSATDINDIIDDYTVTLGGYQTKIIPANVLHIKDTSIGGELKHIEGVSRLTRLKYPLSNLMAVYEARNAIYVKRGAIGAIVSNSKDDSGNVALTPKEKQQLLDDYNNTYGITNNRNPTMVTGVPVSFVRFNLSIQELQPFEETLADAVQIAGVYNIPAVLIPRKDQSTFSNQDTAEKSLYENVVIPEATSLCEALNQFLGLENDGMYLDVSFDHIPVLQPNARDKADTDKVVADTCKMNFLAGVITLNEWLAKMGGDMVENPLYNKKILEMSDEEVAKIERFIR